MINIIKFPISIYMIMYSVLIVTGVLLVTVFNQFLAGTTLMFVTFLIVAIISFIKIVVRGEKVE